MRDDGSEGMRTSFGKGGQELLDEERKDKSIQQALGPLVPDDPEVDGGEWEEEVTYQKIRKKKPFRRDDRSFPRQGRSGPIPKKR
jgi:hypothetical protein